ncbi:unknown [Clostridium sp. CAG:798]|jgi:regulatory protein YycI of two-component signal transduction system YycFG|nr:unknown [Clostridium sp. CAG:798]HBJ12622.1 hypothetical protein [Clostridiales bacterium]
MKKENGLTHMTTIFLVIIILVLILVAVRFVELQYKNEESETIKTNMLAIQGKAKIIAEEEKALKKELAGIKISDKKEEENIKKLLEQQNITIDENSKYYVLDKENLKEIGLGNIELESDQYYIVNYDNLEILYTKGVQIGDNILYKLSDFNKLNEEKDFVEENIKE